MPRHELSYPQEKQNSVNRYKHQATYSLSTIHRIVNSTNVLHVSFNPPDSPFPVILPLIGQMGSFERPSADIGEVLDCYLHGYVSSRIMKLTKKGVEEDGDGNGQGLPVCICASRVDGLVLTLTPNSHNYNYRSATLFGYATPVTSVEEKLYAMELITNSVVPSRYANTRVPPNPAEMSSTQILRVKISSASAKVREGTALDDRGDMEDEEVMGRVWTGVLPVYEVVGAPVDGPYNKVGEVPEHVRLFREGVNEGNRAYAEEAARKAAPVKRKEVGEEE